MLKKLAILSVLWSLPWGLLASDAVDSRGFKVGTLDCDLSLAENPHAELAFAVQRNQRSFKVGDNLILDIEAQGDLYLSIIDHGSDPAVPHRGHILFKNVFIKKGSTYRFPPPNAGRLRIDGPAGENTMELIASKAPLRNTSANSKNVNYISETPPASDNTPQQETYNCTHSFVIRPATE